MLPGAVWIMSYLKLDSECDFLFVLRGTDWA